MTRSKKAKTRDLPSVFISYTQTDVNWAAWIAWTLDTVGYRTIFAAWHFRPGEDFVLRMQQAASEADFTIAVISDAYLTASFTHPEWAAAVARDPLGTKRTLIPVRVVNCQPKGILQQRIRIDLFDLDESSARKALLAGLSGNGKPKTPPRFPSGIHPEADSEVPFPKKRLKVPPISGREASLWRTAYSFLRLDQLPLGGWGKSLPQWMESIWEGDSGSILRSPDMRSSGGTDFTCGSFQKYDEFICRCLSHEQLAKFARENGVAGDLLGGIQKRVDHDHGVNTAVTGRRVPGKVNLRHTAMALIALLLVGKPSVFGLLAKEELQITTTYLIKNLKYWHSDESYGFGMFAALSKLRALLQTSHAIAEFAGMDKLRGSLIGTISSVLSDIGNSLLKTPRYAPLPPNTRDSLLVPDPFFVPYGKFWRMERSGFLMYVPLLLTEDRRHFIENIERDGNLKKRLFHCFDALLEDLRCPFALDNAEESLAKYHRDEIASESPRDWGLTAQLR